MISTRLCRFSDLFPLSALRALLGTSVLCMIALCCQIADATLPSEPGHIHFDLDPVGSGLDVGSGESLSEFFDDTFNFSGSWLAERQLGNPDPNAPDLEFDLVIVWPGSEPVESTVTLPAGGYLGVSSIGAEADFGLPETNFGYHFSFHNPTSHSIRVDAGVTEGEFLDDPHDFDFGFFLTDGTPAPKEYGGKITFGPVSGEYVSMSFFIPEPTTSALTLAALCLVMGRRRA